MKNSEKREILFSNNHNEETVQIFFKLLHELFKMSKEELTKEQFETMSFEEKVNYFYGED